MLTKNLITALAIFGMASPAFAQDFTLTLKDKKFTPVELVVPAGQQFKITVKNMGDTVAEFESSDLHREKIISPGGSILVSLGPLDTGTYEYYDEFNEDTARGKIIAK